jgi:hypothetical protein
MRYPEQGKRFMLPYGSLEYDPKERCMVAAVHRSVFENTPGMAEPLSAD